MSKLTEKQKEKVEDYLFFLFTIIAFAVFAVLFF